MLLAHLMRAAASRTFCTAGSNRPIRMAMMAITTSSSISVKPRRTDVAKEPFIGRVSQRRGGTAVAESQLPIPPRGLPEKEKEKAGGSVTGPTLTVKREFLECFAPPM